MKFCCGIVVLYKIGQANRADLGTLNSTGNLTRQAPRQPAGASAVTSLSTQAQICFKEMKYKAFSKCAEMWITVYFGKLLTP